MKKLNIQWKYYVQLMRLDKPIGIFLLLWPTLFALWIAGEGSPNPKIVLIFIMGVVIMRSAGCVINDIADRKVDGKVTRTSTRPLAIGIVSVREALILFCSLLLMAFLLVLQLNTLTIVLSFAALLLAVFYPFMKRITNLPQMILGIAFAWSIPMVFMALTEQIPLVAWVLYAATVFWVIAYDTQYAMVDRMDDIKIGVKSTAILFGQADRAIIFVLQIGMLGSLILLGQMIHSGSFYYLGVVGAALFIAYQQYLIRDREPKACFKAFLNNNLLGTYLFLGILFDYLNIC